MFKYDLKYVPYDRMFNDFISQVAYVILEDKCIFTAAHTQGSSTINRAEDIAANICKKEGRTVDSLRWFDLQTRYRYRRGSGDPADPGSFEFDEVVFREDGYADRWETTICPQHVTDLFKCYYIPGEPKQVFHRGRENAQRVEFYDPSKEPVPPIDEFVSPPPGIEKLAGAAIRMGAKCWSCGGPLTMENIRFRNDSHGWKVEGLESPQWLWFECSTGTCRYQTSFAKLRIPGKAGDEHYHQPGEGDGIH